MKNRRIAFTLFLVMIIGFVSGCGSNNKTDDGIKIVAEEYPPSRCVELARWKGIELGQNSFDYTEEDVIAYAVSAKEAVKVKDPEALAEKGDIVNIDYSGKIDGETFDGGSGVGEEIPLGNGYLPKECEEAMIGMKAGEIITVKLTFSDDQKPELSGKMAEYTIKLNGIKRKPDPTEEELKKAEEEVIENQMGRAMRATKQSAWEKMTEESIIKMIPESCIKETEEEYESQICSIHGSIEEYKRQGDLSEDDWEKELKRNSEIQAEKQLLISAFAEDMKIGEDSEAYKAKVEEVCKLYGMNIEEMESMYGREGFKCMVYQEMVIEKIIEEAATEPK